MVEIVPEDEIVAIDGFLGREPEGDTILVLGFVVWWEGEVGGGGGRAVGEAAVGLLERRC